MPHHISQHGDSEVVERFLTLVRSMGDGDPAQARAAYRTLFSWPAEGKEELIFRTVEKYAAEKRRLIEFNNRLVLSKYEQKPPDSVLILLPFCLQWRGCPHQVAWRIENCAACGQCPIGGLKGLAEAFRVPVRIALRAAFAPDFVREVRPELVVAVACEHDLLSGMLRVWPCDCYGLINERPEGPCKNTRIEVGAVEKILERFLGPRPARAQRGGGGTGR